MMQKMIWMTYLNSSHFSNRLRHFICQILIYGFKDMNYSILNVKRKNKVKFILLLFIQNILLHNHCYLFKQFFKFKQ